MEPPQAVHNHLEGGFGRPLCLYRVAGETADENNPLPCNAGLRRGRR